jgi:hypothetical protein
MRAAGNASKNVFARLCLFGCIPALRPRASAPCGGIALSVVAFGPGKSACYAN